MGDFLLNHLENVRRWLLLGLLIAGGVLSGALLIGCLIFELDAALIISWFCSVVSIIFVALLVWALLVFLVWFLIAPPCNLLIFIGAVAMIVGVAVIGLKVLDSALPVIDLGEILVPMLSFLN
jgi:hypothetical protein